jgi:hypothetical protein
MNEASSFYQLPVAGAMVIAVLEVRNQSQTTRAGRNGGQWRMMPGRDERGSWRMLPPHEPDRVEVPSAEVLNELCDWLFNCPMKHRGDPPAQRGEG